MSEPKMTISKTYLRAAGSARRTPVISAAVSRPHFTHSQPAGAVAKAGFPGHLAKRFAVAVSHPHGFLPVVPKDVAVIAEFFDYAQGVICDYSLGPVRLLRIEPHRRRIIRHFNF